MTNSITRTKDRLSFLTLYALLALLPLAAAEGTVPNFGQCGGIGWTSPTQWYVLLPDTPCAA
jgi:hypothetical protein